MGKATLFWVDIGYACFGVESNNDIVIAVAPIAKWMLGKRLQDIKPWLLKRSAKVIEINKNIFDDLKINSTFIIL